MEAEGNKYKIVEKIGSDYYCIKINHFFRVAVVITDLDKFSSRGDACATCDILEDNFKAYCNNGKWSDDLIDKRESDDLIWQYISGNTRLTAMTLLKYGLENEEDGDKNLFDKGTALYNKPPTLLFYGYTYVNDESSKENNISAINYVDVFRTDGAKESEIIYSCLKLHTTYQLYVHPGDPTPGYRKADVGGTTKITSLSEFDNRRAACEDCVKDTSNLFNKCWKDIT